MCGTSVRCAKGMVCVEGIVGGIVFVVNMWVCGYVRSIVCEIQHYASAVE